MIKLYPKLSVGEFHHPPPPHPISYHLKSIIMHFKILELKIILFYKLFKVDSVHSTAVPPLQHGLTAVSFSAKPGTRSHLLGFAFIFISPTLSQVQGSVHTYRLIQRSKDLQ